MQCTIERVTPFTKEFENQEPREHNAVAAVTLQVGPVRMMARLFKTEKDQRMWLQFPGKKLEDNKWFDYVRFTDQKAFEAVQQRAVELYQTTLSPN